MHIEIIKEFSEVSSKQVKDKIFYSQRAFLVLKGNPFPVSFSISVDSPAHAYPVGKYILSSESFVIDQYSNLTLSRWNLGLTAF